MLIILFLLSIVPIVLILIYFEHRDKGRKEPKKLKREVFISGFLAVLVAFLIELPLDYLFFGLAGETLLYFFLSAFVTAALVEEGLKFWVVKNKAYNEEAFDEVMDGITYTIIASMGFAAFENILYVLGGGVETAIIRALTAVPAHAMFSGIMGYHIGKSKKLEQYTARRNEIIKGISIAIFYHGLYNFILFSETALMILIIPLLLIMGIHLERKIRKAHIEDGVIPQKTR